MSLSYRKYIGLVEERYAKNQQRIRDLQAAMEPFAKEIARTEKANEVLERKREFGYKRLINSTGDGCYEYSLLEDFFVSNKGRQPEPVDDEVYRKLIEIRKQMQGTRERICSGVDGAVLDILIRKMKKQDYDHYSETSLEELRKEFNQKLKARLHKIMH